MLHRVRNQGYREPRTQAVPKELSTRLLTDNGHHPAGPQSRNESPQLGVRRMVRVRDGVDAWVRAPYWPACGKNSNGRVSLVPLKHGRMADLRVVYSMDAPSSFLNREHIREAQQLYQLQASRIQYHPGPKLEGELLQQ